MDKENEISSGKQKLLVQPMTTNSSYAAQSRIQ